MTAIETLLVSANGKRLAAALNKTAYHVKSVNDTGKAMETLRDARYELIMLDEVLVRDEITSVLKEIKRRVPLVPVLVFSASADSKNQTDLMEAGADDCLTPDLSSDELERRLRLILRQRKQAQMLAQRNHNLQSITLLARRMHSAADPLSLIHETIDRACGVFKLYGMAVVLVSGNTLQLYAGREGCVAANALYESIHIPKDYDPFWRVIQSGIVQVFQHIVVDPHFVPIPTLPAPESAIILPLAYQEQKLGALAVFGTYQSPLGYDDLLTFELFASQFSVALNNTRYSHSQRISVQSSQHLLRAWQRFINVQTETEIAATLHELVADIPNVGQALVWVYPNNPAQSETIIETRFEDVARSFQQLEANGQISALLQRLDENHLQPLTLQQGLVQKDPLMALFKGLRGQQLMVVPVMDSARFIGGIIASVGGDRQYSSEDSKVLAASIAHAAGLAIERATLIQDMAEKSARLETLLRSTSQGIFFMDDRGNVTFCNPQFTELTAIQPSEVLGYAPDVLLECIARQTDNPSLTMQNLRQAVERLVSTDPQEREDYPIVNLTLTDPPRQIDLEFMLMSDANGNRMSWAGIVRDQARYSRTDDNQSILLGMMSERIRVPYAEVRGLVQTLSEQHSRFTHRERSRFLRQIEASVERMGYLWDNILEMYNLQASGLSFSPEQVDLYELIQRMVDSRAFADYRRFIQIEAPSNLPLVEVDELRLEQAILNVLRNAIQYSPRGATISLRLESEGEAVRLTVRDQGVGIPADQIEQVFSPFFHASNNTNEEGSGLGLHLAHEVVARHGGSMALDSTLGKGTTVSIVLPIKAQADLNWMPPALPTATVTEPVIEAVRPAEVRHPANSTGRRVSERPMQTVMMIEGRSTIVERLRDKMDDEYEVIVYTSPEEALRDVNSIRLDLIFLDANLAEANGLDICERLCKRTEVPIIMLADEPSEAEKVRALMIGADDYIANPISDEELVARVNVIFKRRRIPDRTREPLDLGNLFVDFARREVFLENKPLELTRIEYDLLHTLAVNQGQVLTHKQLLEKVWGPEYQAETQYLWVNVSRLRKKLEPTPDSPRYIHTQPGVGYVFRPS